MAFVKRDSASETRRPVQELGEDLAVAILEYLDRHPHTSTREIHRALRLVKRRVDDLSRRLK